MTIQLLIIDDRPDFAPLIAQLLRSEIPAISIRGVDGDRPCLEALQIVKAEGVAQLYFLIDLHLAHHTGVISEKGGANFAAYLLIEYAAEPGLAERIVLYSSHTVNGIELAAELGVRFIRKQDVGNFLRVGLPRLLAKRDRETAEQHSQARVKRQERDADWFYQIAEAYRRNAGQIAAVFEERVWGVGPSVESALREARRHPGCPGMEELIFIAIPEHVFSDDRGRPVEVLELQTPAGAQDPHLPSKTNDDPS